MLFWVWSLAPLLLVSKALNQMLKIFPSIACTCTLPWSSACLFLLYCIGGTIPLESQVTPSVSLSPTLPICTLDFFSLHFLGVSVFQWIWKCLWVSWPRITIVRNNDTEYLPCSIYFIYSLKISLIIRPTLYGRFSYHPWFIDEETGTESQALWGSWWVVEPVRRPGKCGSKGHRLNCILAYLPAGKCNSHSPGLEAVDSTKSGGRYPTPILSREAKHRQATLITLLSGNLSVLLSEEIPPRPPPHFFMDWVLGLSLENWSRGPFFGSQ